MLRCFSLTSTLLLSAALIAPLAARGAGWAIPEATSAQLESSNAVLDALDQLLPRRLGQDGLADQLDFDTDAAIAFVSSAITFEPYVGVMKGADGTAATHAGNAWDQAVLLAALLRTMGADAEIVLGALSDADAERLVRSGFGPRTISNGNFDAASVLGAVAAHDPALAQRLGVVLESPLDGSVRTNRVDARASDLAQQLSMLLAQSGHDLNGPTDAEAFIHDIAADYAWVRWRDRAADPWSDVHPAFGETPSPTVTPRDVIVDQVPIAAQHRLSLTLEIERDNGTGTMHREAVMATYDRPTAELFKTQLVLEFGPLGSPTTTDDNSAFLLPFLNGGVAAGARAVSAIGLTADAADAASAPGAVFATVSGKLAAGIGQLTALDSADPGTAATGPRLTGVILTIEITAPGQPPVIEERRLVDLRSPDDVPFATRAAFSTIIDVDVGPEDGLLSAQRMIATGRKLLPALPPMLAWSRGGMSDDDAATNAAIRDLPTPQWGAIERNAGLFRARALENELIVRPSPFVTARHTLTGSDSLQHAEMDIISNPVDILTEDETANFVMRSDLVIRHGVRETLIESAVAASGPDWANTPPTQLVSDVSSLLAVTDGKSWPRASIDAATRDLATGKILALTPDSDRWWRVDPETGQSLGMSRYGGNDATEYAIMVIGTGLSVFFFHQNVKGCDESYPGNQAMADCCIVGNLATTYGSAAVGSALGAGGGLMDDDIVSAAFVEAPWTTAVGVVVASLGVDVAWSQAEDAVTSPLIESACTRWLAGQ